MVRDLGIDIADIWIFTGISIAFTPASKVAIAGPQKAIFALLKELNHGKPINDLEMWKNVAKAARDATGSAIIGVVSDKIDTGIGIVDKALETSISVGESVINGEKNILFIILIVISIKTMN